MKPKEVAGAVQAQRQYFSEHYTRSVSFRREALELLRKGIAAHEQDIFDALYKDLRKSNFEAYASEVGQVLEEIRYHLKNINRWVKPRRVPTPIVHQLAKSSIMPEPYGTVLIMSPWNYPFQLAVQPMVGAISAGNCVVLKPSEYSPNTTEVVDRIITEIFPPEYIRVYEGGLDINKALLKEHFDYILFTGSPEVGKIVMEAASKHLTPLTLELGGKSPCIVDETANLEVAARRIVWGKFMNAGQTCIAPDYLLVQRSVAEKLIERIKKYIEKFFGEDIKKSPDYGRIINERQFDRLIGYMKNGKTVYGGAKDKKDMYIQPTLLADCGDGSDVMTQEVFGPILPVRTYETLEAVADFVNARPKPLSLYIFSRRRRNIDMILNRTSSGGVCINETLVQAGSPFLPFGGVGNSGMGAYHGKSTFETFSHFKPVISKSTLIDIPLRYPPYTPEKLETARKYLK